MPIFDLFRRDELTADALRTALAPQPEPETPTIGVGAALEPTFDDFVRSVHSNIDERISGLSQLGTLGSLAAQALSPTQGLGAREQMFNIVSGMGREMLADATQRLVRIAREGPLEVMRSDVREDPARPLFELAEMMPFGPKGTKIRVTKGKTPKSHIFGGIEVVENPSQRMMEQMADEVVKQGKSQFLRESTGEARRAAIENTTLRGLKDAEGNVFVWKGTDAVHADIEKQLKAKGLFGQGVPQGRPLWKLSRSEATTEASRMFQQVPRVARTARDRRLAKIGKNLSAEDLKKMRKAVYEEEFERATRKAEAHRQKFMREYDASVESAVQRGDIPPAKPLSEAVKEPTRVPEFKGFTRYADNIDKPGSPRPAFGLRRAGDVVDNRRVRSGVPNMSSIDASVVNPEVLEGLYEVPMSEFSLTGKHYSVAGNKRIEELADQIQRSGEISPLIVVKDEEGFYILEGGTRAEALYRLGAKSFPAKVVIEHGTD